MFITGRSNNQILSDTSASSPSAKKWKAIKVYASSGAPGLLSIEEGEILIEVSPEKDGWIHVKNNRDEEGAVPANCLGF